MAWSAPADPVGGTVITTAWAITNVTDNLRWLRLLTGNADPPGSAYVVVSTSTTGTSWQKVPADAIADGAIVEAKLGAGAVTTTKLADSAVTGDKISNSTIDGSLKLTNASVTAVKLAAGAAASNVGNGGVTAVMLASGAAATNVGASGVTESMIANSAVTASKLATGAAAANVGNGGVTSAMLAAGAAIANVGNGGVTAVHLASGAAATNIGNGGVSSSMLAAGAALANLADGSIPEAKLDVNNDPTDTHLLSWNATAGKPQWVSAPSGTAGIPSGLIAFFVSSGALASATGWSAYTAAAGRMLACVGQVFGGNNFADAGDYGSSWDHAHTGNTWTGGTGGGTGTGTTATGTTGGPSPVNGLATAGGVNLPEDDHTHSIPSLGVTVSSLSVTGVTISGNTTAATWTPPIHSLRMGQKS